MVAAFRSFTGRASTALGNLDRFSNEATTVLGDVRRGGTLDKLNQGMTSLDSLGSLTQVSGSLDRVSENISEVGQLSSEARTLLRDLQGTGGLRNLDATLVETRRTMLLVGQTAEELRTFLAANQNRIVTTLDSIKTTSDRLQGTLNTVDPILSSVQKSEILDNLNTISANAAQLSKNLQTFSSYLNDPATVVLLQQLLESSRAAFSNLQKITSDLDQITGDPDLREKLIRLIQGLSNLVSSSQQLQNQYAQSQTMARVAVQIATLAPQSSAPKREEKK